MNRSNMLYIVLNACNQHTDLLEGNEKKMKIENGTGKHGLIVFEKTHHKSLVIFQIRFAGNTKPNSTQ